MNSGPRHTCPRPPGGATPTGEPSPAEPSAYAPRSRSPRPMWRWQRSGMFTERFQSGGANPERQRAPADRRPGEAKVRQSPWTLEPATSSFDHPSAAGFASRPPQVRGAQAEAGASLARCRQSHLRGWLRRPASSPRWIRRAGEQNRSWTTKLDRSPTWGCEARTSGACTVPLAPALLGASCRPPVSGGMRSSGPLLLYHPTLPCPDTLAKVRPRRYKSLDGASPCSAPPPHWIRLRRLDVPAAQAHAGAKLAWECPARAHAPADRASGRDARQYSAKPVHRAASPAAGSKQAR
jgi:hypothetical protein